MWEVGTKDWGPFEIGGIGNRERRCKSCDAKEGWRCSLLVNRMKDRKEFWHDLFQVWIIEYYEDE